MTQDKVTQDKDVSTMRRAYQTGALDENGLAPDWLTQFDHWLAEAVESGMFREPNAMVVATATPDGRPSARTVLLKAYDENGLVFYSNYESRKGHELAANPHVCCVFSWVALERQVIVEGTVERTNREDSAAYFASRPHGSRLGALVSPQSRVVASRAELDDAWAAALSRYPEGSQVPLPDHWGGFRVVPSTVEFWQGRHDRLHDRLRYRRAPDERWVVERLAP